MDTKLCKKAPQKQEFKTFGLKLNNTCRQVHSAVNEDN